MQKGGDWEGGKPWKNRTPQPFQSFSYQLSAISKTTHLELEAGNRETFGTKKAEG
jgi:hypothetical protein